MASAMVRQMRELTFVQRNSNNSSGSSAHFQIKIAQTNRFDSDALTFTWAISIILCEPIRRECTIAHLEKALFIVFRNKAYGSCAIGRQ